MDPKVGVSIYCCNRLLGESIARILTKLPEFRVAVAPAGEPLRSEVYPLRSVLLLDSLQMLELHQTSFSETCRKGAEIYPLLVAMEEDKGQFLRAIRQGVLGYILQDASAADVVAAVRAVAQGAAVCPPRLTRILFDVLRATPKRVLDTDRTGAKVLTRRELELVPLIGRGLTNKEIAAKLNLSEETIKSHIHRMLRKVGVENRRGVFEACQTEAAELQS